MKIIIEEGDAGGLIPGVYEASEAGAYVDCFGADEVYLKLNLHVDMAQKPKPVPTGGRYDFEFKRFEQDDPAVTNFEATVYDRTDPSQNYHKRLCVSSTMFGTVRQPTEIIEYAARELTHHVVRHVVENLLQNMRDSTVKAFTNSVKPTDPPPVATCDKTFQDCAKHGNTLQYCGYVNVQTGKHVPCPHTFGEPACTGGVEFKAPSAGEVMEAADIANAHMPSLRPQPGMPVGVDPQGRPLVFNDKGLVDYATGDVDVVRKMLRANRDLPEGVNPSTFLDQPKDCDVCYGTGRFKGFGGPCSEGCPTKGGK